MRKWLAVLACGVALTAVPARADVVVDEDPEEEAGVLPVDPIRAGSLEIVPIVSFRLTGGSTVYQVGASVAYAITNRQQVGASFVMGNRLYGRAGRRRVAEVDAFGRMTGPAAIDDGLGSTLTGFYRYNLPLRIQRRTFPFIELFGGRDFGWGDASEAGGGVGVRKSIGRGAAVTSQYSYAVLVSDGRHQGRHIVSAGVSMLFR